MGPVENAVASSSTDNPAGLSGEYMVKTPPRFWACATSARPVQSIKIAVANARKYGNIFGLASLVFRPWRYCAWIGVRDKLAYR
jgi:hypothetical protein